MGALGRSRNADTAKAVLDVPQGEVGWELPELLPVPLVDEPEVVESEGLEELLLGGVLVSGLPVELGGGVVEEDAPGVPGSPCGPGVPG